MAKRILEFVGGWFLVIGLFSLPVVIVAWGCWATAKNLDDYDRERARTECGDVTIKTPTGESAVVRRCWRKDGG